jgi:hypothetical protein
MRRVLRMAMWRRPPGVEPPVELFKFVPADWPAGSYEPEPLQMFEPPRSEREQAFSRWKAARRDWVAKHPNSSLGDPLDLLIGERRARFGDLEARLSGHVGVVRLRRRR